MTDLTKAEALALWHLVDEKLRAGYSGVSDLADRLSSIVDTAE